MFQYRPLVCEKTHTSYTNKLLPESILLINWSGYPLRQIGRMVTNLCMRELNCCTTVTALRSNMETTSAQALDDGRINTAQAKAITSVIGHSEATARRSYHVVDTPRNVRLTHSAVTNLGYNNDEEDELSDGEHTQLDNHNIGGNIQIYATNPHQPIPWGTQHSFWMRDCDRVPFSPEELNYLRSLVTILKSNNTFDVQKVASQCIQMIKKDRDAWPIFHERHVLKTCRLRPGLVKLNIGVK